MLVEYRMLIGLLAKEKMYTQVKMILNSYLNLKLEYSKITHTSIAFEIITLICCEVQVGSI